MIYRRIEPHIKAKLFEGGIISAAKILEAFELLEDAYVASKSGGYIVVPGVTATLYPNNWLVHEGELKGYSIWNDEDFLATFESVPPPGIYGERVAGLVVRPPLVKEAYTKQGIIKEGDAAADIAKSVHEHFEQKGLIGHTQRMIDHVAEVAARGVKIIDPSRV